MDFVKNGVYSIILCIIGLILLLLSYSIFTNPNSSEKIVILLFLLLSIASIIASIIFGVISIKNDEKGIIKYIGISLLILILLVIVGMPIIAGIFGFNTP